MYFIFLENEFTQMAITNKRVNFDSGVSHYTWWGKQNTRKTTYRERIVLYLSLLQGKAAIVIYMVPTLMVYGSIAGVDNTVSIQGVCHSTLTFTAVTMDWNVQNRCACHAGLDCLVDENYT